ncbi:hypothetical protein [Candidatus Liberibacter asiaticus]|uniref:hypothetical protein n=1 Tax=Liberibacter asiaticus TaxID=34021 RepID=UPI001F3AC0CA|nr:hypothetical protein [Candidatus Liberibacter asiaticus]
MNFYFSKYPKELVLLFLVWFLLLSLILILIWLVQADVDRAFSEMYGNSEQAAEKNSSSESKSKADLNKMNAPDSLPS